MTDAVPPNRAVDPAKWAFDIGTDLLSRYGHGGRPARTIVARWLREAGTPLKLIDILVRAGAAERGDILAFVNAALKPEPASAATPEPVNPDAVLELRCRDLARVGMVHLLSPTDQARARAKGWLGPDTGIS